jgi:hypothetical protein
MNFNNAGCGGEFCWKGFVLVCWQRDDENEKSCYATYKFFIMLDASASFVGPVVQGIEGFKSPQMGERVNKPSM